MSAPQFVIQDPYHEYGTRIVEHIHRRYGYRAICLFTSRAEREPAGPKATRLPSECVAADYDLAAGIEWVTGRLRTHHHVVAVIPFDETSLLPAAELASRLGLAWPDPVILGRFRNKFELKRHLRSTAPRIRINASQIVQTSRHVAALRQSAPFNRFVLKPNDGYGNRAIGLFERGCAERDIVRYLDAARQHAVVMEEYIEGREYFVNGQVDVTGRVFIVAIFQYLRLSANGRHDIDYETLQVRHGTPLFDALAGYAESVIAATGLTRSPFHLELKVDALGPCLIEVAARLPGHGNAILSGELHGGQLDLIEMACHYYLQTTDFGAPALNWAAYNSQIAHYVHGVSHRRERIYDLQGIAEVEALPQFHRWIKRPAIGCRVERTLDCLSMPWSVLLKAATEEQAATAAAEVRRLIRWNRRTGLARRAALSLSFLVRRGPARLRRALLDAF